MLGTGTAKTPLDVGFILVPEFSMMAFSSALEPLRAANRHSGRQLYAWHIYSADGEAVAASNGIPVPVESAVSAIDRIPQIIVCSGLDAGRFDDRRVLACLRRLARMGTGIGAISTASHILARAGLLDSYRCTIHWEGLPAFTEKYPDLDVTGSLFEIDRDRFTCSGGVAALDLMLHLISRQHGPDLGTAVAETFLHVGGRRHSDPQRWSLRRRLGIRSPKLLETIGHMESAIEIPLTRRELAERAGLSVRQLERLFHKYLGRAPARYYLELRLERARLLLQQTSMTVLEVSMACGFVSASHFSQCYRKQFNRTPRSE